MKSNLRAARRRAWAMGATAVLGMCASPTVAWAQNIDTRAQTAGADESDQSFGVEEIVVTAEKRAEGLQNIPIAITALSGATLEKAGVSQVGDLTQLAPSLQFGTRSTNVFIAVRGIGQAGQDIGSQSGVTVSLDNVPLLNHFMMNPGFLDVERVEVLRGPQGTIAGRNATGGAINVYSKMPNADHSGEASLTVGDYARVGLKGYVNTPLTDNLMARVSFHAERADGWTKNGYLDRRNDDTAVALIRGQLLYRPSETFSIRALVEYTRDWSDPSFNMLLGRAVPGIPSGPEVPGYAFPRNDPKNLTFYINEPNRRDVSDLRATVVATAELSPNVTLTSTTGLIDHDIDLTDLDVDLTPAVGSRFDLIGLYARQFTQEFTLTANLGGGADLVAGLFYMHGDSSEPLYMSLATYRHYLIYLPAERLDSYAAYAQFRYNLTDSLRATIGGRYTIDNKSYDMDATAGAFTALLSANNKWKAFTPRFVLDFTPNNNSLIYASVSRGFKSGGFNTLGDITQAVNTFNPEYVWNYEVGLKATMFDKRLRFGLTGFYADYTNLQQTVFRTNEDTGVRFPKVENSSTAKIKGIEFEVEAAPVTGLRLTGAVTRLDGSFGAFCNNDPLYPTVPTDPECVGVTSNGKPLPPGAISLEGNRLTQAPKWQFNTSGQYSFAVADNLEISARADYKWQSRVYFDIYNNPLNSQAPYGLLNASLAVGSLDRRWSVTGWIRNAFDVRYVSQGTTSPGTNPAVTGSIGTPRMYGATLYRRF